MSPFKAGVVLIVVVLVGTYLGFTKAIPFRHHFTIHAAFRSVNNINKNSFVRIAGVNVGKVTGIHHVSGGEQAAIVDMRIDSRGLPIHKDATLMIRPRIFLEGNFFVDIHPGSPSAANLHDGETIPIQQTAAPVQLDQLLSVLKTSTRADLQRLLHELDVAFSGRGGRGFNNSIAFWGPAYRGSAIVNDASLGTAQHDLSGYVASSGAVAQALDADPQALKDLITNFNKTATPLAQQNQALAAAIAELPRTLSVGTPALGALNDSFPSLRRLVAELRPAVRSSGPVLTAGVPFAREARALVSTPELRGLVKALGPAVPALTALNLSTVPLFQQVRLASSCQNSVILPWSQQTLDDPTFPAAGPVYQEQPKALVGLGGDSREGDANGLWFRVLAAAGNFATPSSAGALTLSNFPLAGSNPVKPSGGPVYNETTPCETQQQPNLASTPGVAPPGQVNVAAQPLNAKGQALYEHSKELTVKYISHLLHVDGLSNLLKVTSKSLSPSLVPQLRALGKTYGGAK
jgi:virulence factor Mce-like protein